MNVNTSAAPGAATTPQKATGASTRVGATDDGGADGAGRATFLSMLQALSAPESEPAPVLAAASGLSAKGTATSGQGRTEPEHGAVLPKQVAMLPKQGAMLPKQIAAVPKQDAAVPGHDAAVPRHDAAVPGHDAAVPGHDAAVPGHDAAVPGHDAAVPKQDPALAGLRADAAVDANGMLEDKDLSAAVALVTPKAVADQRQPDAKAVGLPQGASHGMRPRPAGSGADRTATLPAGDEAASRAAAEKSTALLDASTALTSKSAAPAQSGSDMIARQAATGAQANREADMSAALAAAGDTVDADSETPLPRPLMAALTSASTAPGVSIFEAGLAGLRGANGGRMGERQHARHATSVADGGFVPWTEAMPTGTSHGASPVYAPGATTPVPQAALAQKVHYWVSRGVQSAELQLEAFGGGSVKVHIAVKGDEAVVEFRTDQPQARKLLLDAMPQLQALLAEEGLNLSGGFVGSSAQQRSGADAQSGRSPDAQRADGHATTVNGAASGAPVRAASGAAVDLFV